MNKISEIPFIQAQEIFFDALKKHKEYKRIIQETWNDLVPDEDGNYSVCEESLKDRLWEEVFPDILNDLAYDAKNEILKLCSITGWLPIFSFF